MTHNFLFRLLEEGCHIDITFDIHGTNIKAHRFILAARSEYFQEMLDGKWNKREKVSISNALVRTSYLYIRHNRHRITNNGPPPPPPQYAIN